MNSKKLRNPVYADEVKVNAEGFEFMYTIGLQLIVKEKEAEEWILAREGYMAFNTMITLDITDTSIEYEQRIRLRDISIWHNGEEKNLDKEFLTKLFDIQI
jgi:hypothetical protein